MVMFVDILPALCWYVGICMKSVHRVLEMTVDKPYIYEGALCRNNTIDNMLIHR